MGLCSPLCHTWVQHPHRNDDFDLKSEANVIDSCIGPAQRPWWPRPFSSAPKTLFYVRNVRSPAFRPSLKQLSWNILSESPSHLHIPWIPTPSFLAAISFSSGRNKLSSTVTSDDADTSTVTHHGEVGHRVARRQQRSFMGQMLIKKSSWA